MIYLRKHLKEDRMFTQGVGNILIIKPARRNLDILLYVKTERIVTYVQNLLILKHHVKIVKISRMPPLTDEILNDHFEGREFLGVYPLLEDNTCWFIAADFDKHDEKDICDPLADVKKFYDVCEVNEIPCYVLRSRSGNGFHGYIFFDKNVIAWKARLVTFEILKEAEVIVEDVCAVKF